MDAAITRDALTRNLLLRMVRLNWHLPGCPKATKYTAWRRTEDQNPDCTCDLERLASMHGITLPLSTETTP